MPMNLLGRRQFLKYGLAAASATALPAPVFAYPDRPIRLIVPFSPGGATDVAARLWAEKMRPTLGTVVIENKGGGGGVIGATEVVRSQPDGHTLLFGNTSTQVLIPVIMPKPPYDPVKDFAGVYIMCLSPTCIVVHELVPARTLTEFIAYAKANPTKLSYGTAGTGTMTNLSGELFKHLIGAPEITHIPYKGAAPGVTDLASRPYPDDDAQCRRAAASVPSRRQGPHPGDRRAAADEGRAGYSDRDRGRSAGHGGCELQRAVCAGRDAQADPRPDYPAHTRGASGGRGAEISDHVGLRADP